MGETLTLWEYMGKLIYLLLLFILAGWFFATLVSGKKISPLTFVWAVFFSALLLPLIAFGLAMLLGTTVSFKLVIPLALALSALALLSQRRQAEKK